MYLEIGMMWKVEGAAFEDGRKPSIWDTFTHAGNGAVLILVSYIYIYSFVMYPK